MKRQHTDLEALRLVFLLAAAIAVTMIATSCAQPQNGSTGIAGKDGLSIVGPSGPQGQPGLNGTTISMVQLCPGTPTYPSVFIEVAFCVDSKLYATYSANGGFSTMLPPGAYSSNAIGSSCNFTVASNCKVSN